MKKRGKSFLALLLALMMAMSLMSITVLAEQEDEDVSSDKEKVSEDILEEEEALPGESTFNEEENTLDEEISNSEESDKILPDEETESDVGETEEDAASNEADEPAILTDCYIDPLYADTNALDDFKTADFGDSSQIGTYASGNVYTDVKSAADYVRGELVNRETIIEVVYSSSEQPDSGLAGEIFNEALKHTGKGNEGDYLVKHSPEMHSSSSPSGNNINITYTVAYYTTAEQEADLTAKLDEVYKSFGWKCESDYEKLCDIYEYICTNIAYDYNDLTDDSYTLKYTAYAALINGKAVCQGFSSLLYRMCLDCGIDCRIITGFGNDEEHAWNIVKLGDCYYNVDSTWDINYKEDKNWKYFLKCDSNFADHERDEEFTSGDFTAAYPMGSNDYNPVTDGGNTKNHTGVVIDETVPATCTTDGYAAGSHCSVCGEVLSAQGIIPALGHDYNDGVVTAKPTCTEEGVMTYTCSRCGETITESINALGHDWDEGEVTTEPTCTEKGVMTYTCSRCGDSYTESIEALGHIHADDDEGIVISEPSCEDRGEREYTCTRCGETYTESIEALGHDWNEGEVTTEPTCTEEGIMTYVCNRCGVSMTRPIDALGHDWDNGVVTTEPTYEEEGEMTYTCTRCGETRIEPIPALTLSETMDDDDDNDVMDLQDADEETEDEDEGKVVADETDSDGKNAGSGIGTTGSGAAPKTADESMPYLAFSMLILAAVGIVVLLIASRKEKEMRR